MFYWYVPSSCQLVVSNDVTFNESFFSVIAETWWPFSDALSLYSEASYVLVPTMILETTGNHWSYLPTVWRGEGLNHDANGTTLQCIWLWWSCSFWFLYLTSTMMITTALLQMINDPSHLDSFAPNPEGEGNPQVIKNGALAWTSSLLLLTKTKAMSYLWPKSSWQLMDGGSDCNVWSRLISSVCSRNHSWHHRVCCRNDPEPFLPPSMSIQLIMQMSNTAVRQAWLKAYCKEVKTIIDAGMFSIQKP